MKKFNKILLIDDDPITNFLNEAVIKKAGIGEVIKVSLNGADALQYIKKECKQENCYPDLIIVDINMPVMDGFEFVKQFRELDIKGIEQPNISMLTTSTDMRDVKKSMDLDVTMLKKPLTLEMLNELFGEAGISVKH
jgi:CheY-like chemotaxis protein